MTVGSDIQAAKLNTKKLQDPK